MNKLLLIILDGFGEGKDYSGNAITRAAKPTIDGLRAKTPPILLKASGRAVGIPEGTQGGSEVGHFTIGAGRIVLQPLEEMNEAVRDGSFFEKHVLVEACRRVNTQGTAEKAALHLLGMISDQGVHAHIDHLFALLELAKRNRVEHVYIHAITDGRDVPEKSAGKFVQSILSAIKEKGMGKAAKIGTMIGRYYAMDRDFNADRIEKAYRLYAFGEGRRESNPLQAVENAYKRGVETDYYLDPIIFDKHSVIKDKDSVICWNFRTDRAREITWCFTGENDPETGKGIGFEPIVRPYWVCMGPYSEKAPVVFPTPVVRNNLAEVLSKAGVRQLRIAETQKYAHVTYFFNSQVEEPWPLEDRLMIDSKRCHSYAEIPEMSAREITAALIKKIDTEDYRFIALNFANCDLVGHSGDLAATIKAVEVVDECLGKILQAAQKKGYEVIITGDHGNAEYMVYEENGEPCPSHTRNPVPFLVVSDQLSVIGTNGELCDIAPTVLDVLSVPVPKEMTGKNLLRKQVFTLK